VRAAKHYSPAGASSPGCLAAGEHLVKQTSEISVGAFRSADYPPDENDFLRIENLVDDTVVAYAQAVNVRLQLPDARRAWIIG
jgi:hypothetical protein